MKSFTTPRFWKEYALLTVETQRRAKKAYKLWAENHAHPSLHFKKVGKLWSVRVDDNHRALADVRGDTAHWLWIGTHAEYERFIGPRR